MRFPAMLVALLLPACGDGTDGIAVPPPMDLTRIERPKTPNTALAAPAGFKPEPDIITQTYPIPAGQLYIAAQGMVADQRRTFLLKTYGDQLQAHFVARSAWMGFPDLIAMQTFPDGPERSTLVLWSRSVYGHSDLGVNRKRVTAWVAALDAKVAH
jgi:Protein of unknown function (DUF1499)